MPTFKSTCPDLEHRDKIIIISFLVVENNNIIYFRRSTLSSESILFHTILYNKTPFLPLLKFKLCRRLDMYITLFHYPTFL